MAGTVSIGCAAFESDLEFLYHALMAHPMMLVDAGRKEAFERYYREEICQPRYEYDSFIHAAAGLTAFFCDGHTNIELPYTRESRCISLHCGWDEEDSRLLLRGRYGEIPAGAEIVAVNGEKIETITQRLSERIPHENVYLVKSRMINYPYQNYHIFSEMNLKWLFGRKEKYPVSFAIGSETVTAECPLVCYEGTPDFADDTDFVSYEIQGDTMWMHLDSCLYNEKYLRTLDEAARICKERGLKKFVLDLSRNMGGSSAVIDAFLKYTGVDSYRRYEMIDYSSGEAEYVTHRKDVICNQKKPYSFPGEMYCKVSCDTFSSARTFAVTLKDNNIAGIIGTPTGGKPDSYGMPRKLNMPESGVRFRVSTSLFLRPDERKEEEPALFPDSSALF